MREEFQGIYGDFLKGMCLNIGSGFTLEKDTKDARWLNLDFNPESGAEIVHNMLDFPWPFQENSFDAVQASHVMEHFSGHNVIRVVYEISRILKVGGWFVVAVPYATHSTSFHNPHHQQRWEAATIGYLCRSQYGVRSDGTPDAGTGAHHGAEGLNYAEWRIGAITYTPDVEWKGKPEEEITEAAKSHLNVIQEMQFAITLVEK